MKIQWFNLMAAIGFLIYAVGAATGKPMAIWEQVFVMGLLSLLLFVNTFQRDKELFEIKERLSDNELLEYIGDLEMQYLAKVYRHKNGTLYEVVGATTINQNGTSYWGLIYRKYNEKDPWELSPLHTRPLHEFIDGRFELVFEWHEGVLQPVE